MQAQNKDIRTKKKGKWNREIIAGRQNFPSIVHTTQYSRTQCIRVNVSNTVRAYKYNTMMSGLKEKKKMNYEIKL